MPRLDKDSRPCRSCRSRGLHEILSLGSMPLANALLKSSQVDDSPEPHFPLDLMMCPSCSLVQIAYTVPAERLFSEYFYFSSYSDRAVEEARLLVERLVRQERLGRESQVVEIASNDGYLLRHYQKHGLRILGIEPAANVAKFAAEEHGIPTLCRFFSAELAKELVDDGCRADVIHANNVLAHVEDLNGFATGVERLLKPVGVAVVEVPYVVDLVEKTEFDTIYHEHLCYFSLTSLRSLFSSNRLKIASVERIPIHGGSLRIFATRRSCGRSSSAEDSSNVESLLSQEADWGVGKLDRYRGFSLKVEKLGNDLRTLLIEIRNQGARIAAYGASAKGSTLLNYLRLPEGTLEFVVDRNPVKQNHYTPGTRLPIFEPEKLLEKMPDYVLLLTWNFADEILKQQSEYRRGGGRFIIPIPEIRVV